MEIDKNIPGLASFDQVLIFSEEEINMFENIFNSDEFKKLNESKSIKNSLWNIFYHLDCIELIKKIQKTLLICLAEYSDYYKESIHSIQWQERIDLKILYPGESEYMFNPSKSFNVKDNIPFSRQIVAEIGIEDAHHGGKSSWEYFNVDEKILKSGEIRIYPASYLYSNTTSTILDGRKIYLRTFFNGGKDFISEDESFDGFENIYMFSYMR
jgi:hypothetical protein